MGKNLFLAGNFFLPNEKKSKKDVSGGSKTANFVWLRKKQWPTLNKWLSLHWIQSLPISGDFNFAFFWADMIKTQSNCHSCFISTKNVRLTSHFSSTLQIFRKIKHKTVEISRTMWHLLLHLIVKLYKFIFKCKMPPKSRNLCRDLILYVWRGMFFLGRGKMGS